MSLFYISCIKESIITKLQKLYSPPRNLRAGNKPPALFLKKHSGMDNLSPARKIFIERPEVKNFHQKVFVIMDVYFQNMTIRNCD